MFDFGPINLQFLASLISPFHDKEILSSIVGAVLGAFLAFVFSIFLQRRVERKSRALELIQEYSSPEFIDVRNDTGKAIRAEFLAMKDGYPSWKMLFKQYGNADDGSQWRKISKIKHFYEKLNFLVKIKEVNLQYVSTYFYEEFHHWNNKYFSKINGADLENQELDVSALESRLLNPKRTRFVLGYAIGKAGSAGVNPAGDTSESMQAPLLANAPEVEQTLSGSIKRNKEPAEQDAVA